MDDGVASVARGEQHPEIRSPPPGLVGQLATIPVAGEDDIDEQGLDVRIVVELPERVLQRPSPRPRDSRDRAALSALKLRTFSSSSTSRMVSPLPTGSTGMAGFAVEAGGRSGTSSMRLEVEPDARALPDFAEDPHMPAGLLHEAVDHAQPEARTLAHGLGREERVEHLLKNIRRHAGAAVADGQHHIEPARHVLDAEPSSSVSTRTFEVSMVRRPPSGIASRALMTRLSSAFSI